MKWYCRDTVLDLCKTHIMGIVNVTPDSFYAADRTPTPEQAIRRAQEAYRQGAALLDVGGQSTRPGAVRVSLEEEWERLAPVLTALAPQYPVSVDTFYPEVAQRALEMGVSVINDVSGSLDGVMPALAARYGAGLVMTHAGGGADDAGEAQAVTACCRFFEQALAVAADAGLPLDRLCLDVGIGFGKSREGDRQVVARLPELLDGLPPVAILCGASRKRVTAGSEAVPPEQRLPGTLALHSVAQWNGARILRCHDVAQAVAAAALVDAIRESGQNG